MRKKLLITGLVLSTAVYTTGCGQENTKKSAGKKSGKPTVCLVMKSLANQFFQDMQKGAQQHVAQRGDLTLQATGIQNETDIDGQVAEIEKCVTQQVDAIVLAPADSRALVNSVKRASDAGIKVVNIDVRLDQGAMGKAGIADKVPYVGPDNEDGAKQSGAVLAKKLGKGGKVVILSGNPGAANAEQRTQGFKYAIKDGGLTLLQEKTAHWETDEAHTVLGNMLTAHPDIQGVLSGNDDMTLGAIKAIQEQHKNIKVASFDNIPAIKPYLSSGVVVATVDQFGAKQAGQGIDYAMNMIKGQSVTGWQKTAVQLITK